MFRCNLIAFVVISVAAMAFAAPATTQTTQPALKPVPLLSPEDEAKTFNLPPGFRAEVVAAEPMVQHPVAIAFDPAGRLWVAEMRNYMPDVDGWGELKPTGRISILEDTDGDGLMDKSTVFLDKLVLPRAVGFAGDGVLIGTPPKLLFCRDTDGDGHADTQEVIAKDYGVPENPENGANGLLRNIDNWIYNANWTHRLRYRDGKFESAPLPDLGQWGITSDDYGRMFFNTNSDYLRGCLIPPGYSTRNPHSPASIADTRIAEDQKVWPANAATVNRGYREGFLRDGRLDAFTAACGPHIYRGEVFPAEFYGNAFVCEATSNLVRRSIVTEKDAKLSAKNAYEGREFIASTYERFRPVNLLTGPEGALYVVDMHHGIIQHKMSITAYAKDQYKQKQLTKHLLTGRIFRIVPDGGAPRVRPEFSKASTAQLIENLAHRNAWWRDTAQRLLVERSDPAAVTPLRELLTNGKVPLDRIHALWTLEGMQQLDLPTLNLALRDRDAKVRAAAVRAAESVLYQESPELLELTKDEHIDVLLQLTLTLGRFSTVDTQAAVARILGEHGDNYMLREAAVTGLEHREIGFLTRLLEDPSWSTTSSARSDVITDIARSITRRNDPNEMLQLAALIGGQPPERQWQQLALLEAIPNPKRDDLGAAHLIEVPEKPPAIDKLSSSSSESVRARASKVAALFQWPGKPIPPKPKVAPLTPRQKELFEIGKVQYALVCAQCHKPDALGQEGKAPPLLNSRFALGPDKRLIRIVLHGARGPITVHDKVWNLDMPGLAAMTDEQIAGVLPYIRRSFGHEASAVDVETVQSIRDWTQARKDGWTEEELLQIK